MAKILRPICLVVALVLVLVVSGACIEPDLAVLILRPGESVTETKTVDTLDYSPEILTLRVQPDEYSDWVTWEPDQYENVGTWQLRDFEVTYRVPPGTPPGDYEFEVQAGGYDSDSDTWAWPASQTVTIHVLPGELICLEPSIVDYTTSGSGATTIHNLSVPVGVTALAELHVYVRGDYDSTSEYADVYIEGTYIGRNDGGTECGTAWLGALWLLTAAQISGWAADGTITVTVENSSPVDTFCTYNEHRVTLCYMPLEADFTAQPRQGEAPLTVQFTDESEPTGEITVWLWDFGDGESSREQNPSHTYAVGIYTVSLTVTGPYGTDREVKADYIEVFTAVVPARLFVRNLQISPAQVYPNQLVTISAKVVNQGGRYGSKRVDLVINGQAEQMTRAGVYPGTAKTISFTTSKSAPGTYDVFVEGETGSFTVLLPPQAPPQAPSAGTAGGLGTGGIIAIIVIGIILIVGIIVAVMLTRRPV